VTTVAPTLESVDATLARVLEERFAFGPDAAAGWHELRERAPIAWHGPNLVISRYEDIKATLRDLRLGKSGLESTEAIALRAHLSEADQALHDELVEFEGTWMVRAPTSERHDRLRRIAHRAFTPCEVARMRDSVPGHVDALLGAARNGVLDVAAAAYHLPLALITEMLGVPEGDREQIHAWTDDINRGLARSADGVRAAVAASRAFRAYVDEIAAQHRANPASVSSLVAAMLDAEADERLTNDELAGLFVQLLFAGHETTTTLIQQGLLELMFHRDQWNVLCEDPSLVDNAVEELLRFVPPIPTMFRVVIEDCELLEVPVRRNQSIRVMLAIANRDPAVFEDPDRLDISRVNAKEHLSFGFGPRFCLGTSLARLGATAALGALAERYPNLRLASDDPFAHRGAGLRRLPALPVELGAHSTHH
jgi:cytochrome P450